MQSAVIEKAFRLEADLDHLKRAGQYRRPRTIDSPQGPLVTINGQELLNFCSNDYLGLASERRLIKAFQHGADKYGVGSGASQLVCGRSTAHEELELELAKLTNRDRALIFSNGYLANLSIVSALCPNRNDLIIEDRLNHASMIDGALLSRATLKRYAHADPASLRNILENSDQKRKLVLTDGVFSMDGDISPLAEIVSECDNNQACLVVDDAHGFGVLGDDGTGTLKQCGLGQEQVPLLMATFGKALGAYGAFVAGPEAFIEMLIQRARPYIYTTALPPALAVTAMEALNILVDEPWRRAHLFSLIRRYQEGAAELGLAIQESSTPIQPLIVGNSVVAVELSEKLFQQGIFIAAIRPPTVPEGTSRLRITLTAAHSEQQVDRLLESLSSLAIR